MTPRFNLLFRGFAHRYFRHFDLDPQALATLQELESRGSIIYVMRYSSRLDYFLFNNVFRRAGLRLSAFANGIRFHYYRPLIDWARIAFQRKRAQPRALDRNKEREHVRTLAQRGESQFLFLRTERFRAWLRGRRPPRQHELDLLEEAVRAIWDSGQPCFVVPLALFWRKGPRTESRFLNLNYGALTRPSDFAKVVSFLGTYRSLSIKTGAPIDLAGFIGEHREEGPARVARKVRRAILIYLYREEKVVQGPTLRPPARVLAQVLSDPGVQRAIDERGRSPRSSAEQARAEAIKIFHEIAARMNSTLLALANAILRAVFRRVFSSIQVTGLPQLGELVKRHPIVLVPNHRSYFDFMIISVLLYQNFVLPPHVGARENMAFGPFGFLLRRVGAFFLRASFDDPLYKEVFRAYLGHLVREGFTQEFFIEGGRSRTGKSMPPRLGMLGWQVDAFIDSARRDFLFVPAAVTYERLVEESVIVGELGGGRKKRESVLGLMRARKYLQRRFGSVHVTFDRPISLGESLGERREHFSARYLERCEAGERERLLSEKREFVKGLGRQIVERINGAVVATATSVAATVLLGAPHRGLRRSEMVLRMQQVVALLRVEGVSLTRALEADAASFDESIAFLQRADLVESVTDPGGEILYYAESRRRAIDIYRNSIAHFLATPSCLARTLLRGASEKEMREDLDAWQDLLYREFHIPSGRALSTSCRRVLDHFEESGWVQREGVVWVATSAGVPLLRCLAEQTRGVIEAYQACCSALLGLGDAEVETIGRKELRRSAARYFENAELLGEAARPEAANDATFTNVLDQLVERGILCERTFTTKRSKEVRYARGESWEALAELRDRLAAALSSR
jgi:glycerol-3-phosphate O-acyltransferase